jgi:SET family sugar efflux transporter-like MFS transporter
MTGTTQPRLPMGVLVSASLFAIGISLASTTPYEAIIAIEALGFSPGGYALILTAASIVGLIASVSLGWLSDRIGDRRIIVLATALIGAVGFGLVYVLRSPAAFVIAYCVILPFGNAAFSQTFAYARVYYDQKRPGDAEFRITVLRSMYAASWVLVPPLAGWIAAVYQVFDVYLLAAVAYLGCGAISLALLASPEARIVPPAAKAEEIRGNGIALPMLVGIGGVLLVNVSIRVSMTATPLAMVNNYGGTISDVGIASGIRALLEIPLMLLWGLAGRRFRKHTLIAAGALVYAVCMLAMTQAQTVAHVFWLQVPVAIAIAALMSVPISYMQEAIRGRVGLSTSLLDVTFVASGLLSAGIFGLVAGPGTYLDLFWIAGALASVGAAILVFAHTVVERRVMRVGRN